MNLFLSLYTGLWASGGVCGETDDTGEVEAEWEASEVSERVRGMFGSMDWE
jgi:hypothetical protein